MPPDPQSEAPKGTTAMTTTDHDPELNGDDLFWAEPPAEPDWQSDPDDLREGDCVQPEHVWRDDYAPGMSAGQVLAPGVHELAQGDYLVDGPGPGPGPLSEQTAQHTRREAEQDRLWSADKVAFDDATRLVATQYAAGLDLDTMAAHHDDVSASLLADAQTGPGRAYAAEYADTARTLIADLRADEAAARAERPEPGSPHPARPGWIADRSGVYVREGGTFAPQLDREAG